MNKKINIFCYKHPNFGIHNLMRYVVIANVVVWILSSFYPGLQNYLMFSPYHILHGQIWRLVSFIFIPPSQGIIAVIAFYFYYMVGNMLESKWGAGPFTIYFFTGVLLTAIYGFILYFVTGISYGLDAEYIYLSMFFSFAALFPDMQVLLFFIIPIKIKWLAWVDGALFLLSFLTTPFPVNFLPVIGVLNFLIFCGGDLLARLRRNRPAKVRVIDFSKEAEKIRKQQEPNLYQHKCAVCGRVEGEVPGLEFRFCSQCAGYHCFCSEHINSHIHFTE